MRWSTAGRSIQPSVHDFMARLALGYPEGSAGPLEFSILAHGKACLTFDELAALRTEPLTGFPAALAPQLLKHSDEQTLASLVAVRARRWPGELERTDFSRWGVVSSSRYIGRSSQAAVINKYKVDGPWGVSVQAVPHRMPHSVPGTLGLALRNHGPSISVGGGPDDQTDVLLSLAGLLRGGQISRRLAGGQPLVAGTNDRCRRPSRLPIRSAWPRRWRSFDKQLARRSVRCGSTQPIAKRAARLSATPSERYAGRFSAGRLWTAAATGSASSTADWKLPSCLKFRSADRSQDASTAEVEGQTKYFLDSPAAVPTARRPIDVRRSANPFMIARGSSGKRILMTDD